jgi:pimeloyl-ACP methyl ester carboxylesterase
VLNGAAFRIEVPSEWNGKLVMYAHGFRGDTEILTVTNPPIRRHLVENGYAWAASSYSRNNYDVRAGVEDTNALALAFVGIAGDNGRQLAQPERYYIIGHSMGGHISAAAIERETLATANNRVAYAGAVPMCGAMAPFELFNVLGGMYVSALALAGRPDVSEIDWLDDRDQVLDALFSSYPSEEDPRSPIRPTAAGERYLSVLKHLTGGERPLFRIALSTGGSLMAAISTFGMSYDVNGVMNRNAIDTRGFTYLIEGDAAASAALNASAEDLVPDANFNPIRSDGLRWVPLVQGQFAVPVVSLHTIGDLFVPFLMQQIYAERAAANGSDDWLVQRAIRGISHCDFTVAEQVDAFDAMTQWESERIRPAGDDVVSAEVVADEFYGCQFTDNTTGPDDAPPIGPLPNRLQEVAACPAN